MVTVKEIAKKMQITGSIAARSAFSKERYTYPACHAGSFRRCSAYLYILLIIQQSTSQVVILCQPQLLADIAPHRTHV